MLNRTLRLLVAFAMCVVGRWAAAEQHPSLSRPITLSLNAEDFSPLYPERLFLKFAEAADVNLVGQLYRKPLSLPGQHSEPRKSPRLEYVNVPAGLVLRDLCNRAGYSFEADGPFLILHNRTRYRDDPFQIDLAHDRRIRSFGNPNHLALQAFLASDAFTDRQRYLLSFT